MKLCWPDSRRSQNILSISKYFLLPFPSSERFGIPMAISICTLLTLCSITDECNIFEKPCAYVCTAYHTTGCYSHTDCNGECINDYYMFPFHCAWHMISAWYDKLYQLMYALKQVKHVQVLTWKRVRDGLGIGLDTGLGIGLGAGLRSLPPLPRRGSTKRPLSGTAGCWGTAVLRSRVSHVSEILRDALLVIRPLPGVPVAGPSSTVSSSSRAAISLRAQYPLISATKARYWSSVLLSSCT